MKTPRFCLERRCQDICLNPDVADLAFHGPAPSNGAKAMDHRPLPRSPSGSFGVAAVGLGSDGTACLERVFARSNEFHACGCFPGAAAARLGVPKCDARLLLVELTLPDGCGIWCARRLLAERPGINVILVTAIRDALLLQRAAAVGIADLLVKPFTVGRCLARLRFVLCRSSCDSGSNPVGPGPLQDLTARPQHLSVHMLREIEEAVLDCLAEGLMYKEIAGHIGRSEAAVKKLINGIYRKLEVDSRVHAVLKWRLGSGMESNSQVDCHPNKHS